MYYTHEAWGGEQVKKTGGTKRIYRKIIPVLLLLTNHYNYYIL